MKRNFVTCDFQIQATLFNFRPGSLKIKGLRFLFVRNDYQLLSRPKSLSLMWTKAMRHDFQLTEAKQPSRQFCTPPEEWDCSFLEIVRHVNWSWLQKVLNCQKFRLRGRAVDEEIQFFTVYAPLKLVYRILHARSYRSFLMQLSAPNSLWSLFKIAAIS